MSKQTEFPAMPPRDADRATRTQFGAVCYRVVSGKLRILLITSRDTGRWVVPKGWPVAGQTAAGSATVEAFEEAGVQGRTGARCIGYYTYDKRMPDADPLPCVVALYPIRVKKLRRKYPESGQRRRKWVSRKQASRMVHEPELARILKDFDPDTTGG